ncbi:hypothetical protein T484DRAFT_1819784, partial [Baffinella frigidus]
LDAGDDPQRDEALEWVDARGNSPLHAAASAQADTANWEKEDHKLSRVDTANGEEDDKLQLCVSLGCSIEEKNAEGKTPSDLVGFRV